jgi:Big-like domain-containing protein/invasin-like protein/filamin/ABP280 repeat protein
VATGTTTRLRIISALALAALAACGGGDLLLPKDGEPAHIAAVRGDNQDGAVGQPLSAPLVVKITDPAGRPVADVEVVFVPPAGGEVAPSATVRTGSNGEAEVQYTLSPSAGEQLIQARAAAIVPASSSNATFKAIAQPGAAETLVAAGGGGQSGQVSAMLAESLAVRAVDHFGNGVAGVTVTWQASGGGSLSPTSVTTGADGRAATQRTLGDRPGTYRSTARAEGLEGSPLSFTSTALAPQLALITPPSATAVAGVPLAQQPELQLQDALGAALNRADVNVTAQIAGGDGSLGGRTTATSDANGRVRFSNLELRGPTGARTIIFAADGFTPVTSNPITVTAGPPAANSSSASVPNGTVGVPTTIQIQVADQFGNPVGGAAAGIAITVGGANPSPGLPVTEVGGGSYSASYVPVHTGSDEIGIQVAGLTLASSPFTSIVLPGPTDPAHSTAEVTLIPNIFYFTIQIVVTARDVQGNPTGTGGDRVQVAVDGASPVAATDNGNGTYSAEFVSLSPSHTVAITLNDSPIQGSPYTTH